MNVKSPAQAAAKWAARAAVASGDYTDGVRNPRRSWEQATKDGEDNYKTGVTAAIARGAFGKGVSEAGDNKWADRAINVGAQRFGPGVAASEDIYENAIAPVLSVIERVDLGPKYPKGDPRNYARVQKIGQALRKMKTG